jgi:hypothetical protein
MKYLVEMRVDQLQQKCSNLRLLFDTKMNHQLPKKLKLIKNCQFNHLIITLILLLTYELNNT